MGITEKTTGLSAQVNTNDFAMYDAFLDLLDFKLRCVHVRDDWYFCVVSSIYALDIIVIILSSPSNFQGDMNLHLLIWSIVASQT